MASSKLADDLPPLLKKYSIVRVGKQVVVAFRKRSDSGGGRHPVLQFMTLEAFDKFHADKAHYVGEARVVITRFSIAEIYLEGERIGFLLGAELLRAALALAVAVVDCQGFLKAPLRLLTDIPPFAKPHSCGAHDSNWHYLFLVRLLICL